MDDSSMMENYPTLPDIPHQQSQAQWNTDEAEQTRYCLPPGYHLEDPSESYIKPPQQMASPPVEQEPQQPYLQRRPSMPITPTAPTLNPLDKMKRRKSMPPMPSTGHQTGPSPYPPSMMPLGPQFLPFPHQSQMHPTMQHYPRPPVPSVPSTVDIVIRQLQIANLLCSTIQNAPHDIDQIRHLANEILRSLKQQVGLMVYSYSSLQQPFQQPPMYRAVEPQLSLPQDSALQHPGSLPFMSHQATPAKKPRKSTDGAAKTTNRKRKSTTTPTQGDTEPMLAPGVGGELSYMSETTAPPSPAPKRRKSTTKTTPSPVAVSTPTKTEASSPAPQLAVPSQPTQPTLSLPQTLSAPAIPPLTNDTQLPSSGMLEMDTQQRYSDFLSELDHY